MEHPCPPVVVHPAGDPSRPGGPGSRLLSRAADLLLPVRCAGCHAPGTTACPRCLARLAGPALFVDGVGPPALPWPADPPVAYVADYAGVARRLLLAYKERGHRGLAVPLAAALVRALLRLAPGGPFAVVAVPSAPRAVRRRGFDHMDLLARTAVGRLREVGVPAVRGRPLRLAHRVRDSAGLSRAERRRERQGSLRVARPDPAPVVIVDDVLTTGATVLEAARALTRGGALVLGVAVVLRTPPRGERAGHASAPTGPGEPEKAGERER